MAHAMNAPEYEPVHYRMQANEETRHANAMQALRNVDWAELRRKSFIPKSLNSFNYKFYYKTYDEFDRREIPLNSEVINVMHGTSAIVQLRPHLLDIERALELMHLGSLGTASF